VLWRLTAARLFVRNPPELQELVSARRELVGQPLLGAVDPDAQPIDNHQNGGILFLSLNVCLLRSFGPFKVHNLQMYVLLLLLFSSSVVLLKPP
jgi:hypothetical protein